MYRFKAFRIILHLAGWLLFLTFPVLFIGQGKGDELVFTQLLSWSFLQFCLCYSFVFYFNAYCLIPKFFLKKNYLGYAVGVLILLNGVYFLQPFDHLLKSGEQHTERARPEFPGPPGSERHGPPPERHFTHIDITSIFIFVMVMAFSLALRLIQQWQATEKRAILAEAERINAELSFLKAQINPHFLYNTLNNIYTLSVTGSAHTSSSIMKLSNIMRYVTDEAVTDFVPLNSELACIGDYIDLQKLRLGKKVTLHYTVSGELGTQLIAPLMLITFIENVFKYGISNHHPAQIVIRIGIQEDEITFFCQNQIFKDKKPTERAGIGIANTRQRLEYLYPGKYQLDINEQQGLFTVKLILKS